MKNVLEFLTPEQKEAMKHSYIVADGTMYVISDEISELTEETFKIVLICDEEGIMVATAEDITYFDPDEGDYDFKIADGFDCIKRETVPEEIQNFLDNILNK